METPPNYFSKPRTSRRILAENLRIFRLKRQISQEALALMANIERSHVSALERAECNVSIDIIERLATALRTDVIGLLTEPDHKELPAFLLGIIRSRISEPDLPYAVYGGMG